MVDSPLQIGGPGKFSVREDLPPSQNYGDRKAMAEQIAGAPTTIATMYGGGCTACPPPTTTTTTTTSTTTTTTTPAPTTTTSTTTSTTTAAPSTYKYLATDCNTSTVTNYSSTDGGLNGITIQTSSACYSLVITTKGTAVGPLPSYIVIANCGVCGI